MKNICLWIMILFLFSACKKEKEISSFSPENWESRTAQADQLNNLIKGKSYLPVYSHIYQIREDRTFDLTVTVSIRNVSLKDTIYILSAEYFNTEGDKVRNYFNNPIFIKPMETVEIIVDESDTAGGSGANFLFNWALKNRDNPPLIEGVMISTLGQQGLSFTTRAVQVH